MGHSMAAGRRRGWGVWDLGEAGGFAGCDRRPRVSLGSIATAIRKAARAPSGPLASLADQLKKRNVEFLMIRRATELILGDVLQRYRNGGAHEHAINLQTCLECVDTLLGTAGSPGLLPQVAGWTR